jgi:hypothetical protein
VAIKQGSKPTSDMQHNQALRHHSGDTDKHRRALGAVMSHWTTELVEERLAAAADTMRRLPAVSVGGHYNAWPEIVRDRYELSGFQEGPTTSSPASPAAVTAMEEALLWLRCLARDDQKLVWARAEHRPWKAIAHEYGVHRSTVHNRYRCALFAIAGMLNSGGAMSRHRDPRHINQQTL